MPKGLPSYFARFLSLTLALYFLNFSVGTPLFAMSSDDHSASLELTEGGSLLEMVLEVDLEIQNIDPLSEDCPMEMEKESCTEYLDIFHQNYPRIALLNFYQSFLLSLHKPSADFQDRTQDITSPPPRS